MPETLRFKTRLPMAKVQPAAPDLNLTSHQWQGSAFLEGLRQAVERAESSHDCRAIYAVIAEAEERIADLATKCMARENLLQMKGK